MASWDDTESDEDMEVAAELLGAVSHAVVVLVSAAGSSLAAATMAESACFSVVSQYLAENAQRPASRPWSIRTTPGTKFYECVSTPWCMVIY
jgi:hypothetical protein